LNEECEDICQAIDWQNVSAELLLEFSMKYPKITKNCRLEKSFEQSLQNSLLNKLHSQNSFINNLYNSNGNQNNSNSSNKRLIEESIFGTVSLMFENLLSRKLCFLFFFLNILKKLKHGNNKIITFLLAFKCKK
jgi:hypothetical protein